VAASKGGSLQGDAAASEDGLLSHHCLDQYLTKADLRLVLESLCSNPADSLAGRKVSAEGASLASAELTDERVTAIFDAIDTEATGLISLRQMLVGIDPASPVTPARPLLRQLGLWAELPQLGPPP
jgi:hypothetical protein